jgi:hypothetical protein
MTQGMKEEPILQMGTDRIILRHVQTNLSQSDSLTEVIEKTGFNPLQYVALIANLC